MNANLAQRNPDPDPDPSRIVVSAEDLPWIWASVITDAKQHGIAVCRDGAETGNIVWPADAEGAGRQNLVIVESGTEMLAARQMHFHGAILSVHRIEERRDLDDVIELVKKLEPETVHVAMRADPIGAANGKTVVRALNQCGRTLSLMALEPDTNDLLGVYKARVGRKQDAEWKKKNRQTDKDVLRSWRIHQIYKWGLISGVAIMAAAFVSAVSRMPQHIYWTEFFAGIFIFLAAQVLIFMAGFIYPWAYGEPWILRAYKKLGGG